MRFFALASVLLGAASSLRSVSADMLMARATGDACVTIQNFAVVSVVIGDVCICINAGVVTDQSVADIGASVAQNGGLIALLRTALFPTNPFASDTVVLEALAPLLRVAAATSILNAPQPSCTYPDNAIPTGCSATCALFDCEPNFIRCGDICLAGNTCSTGTRKRTLGSPDEIRKTLQCPAGFDACAVPTVQGSIALMGRDFECVQTHRDLESCGGCLYPLAGQAQGVDCTAIAESTSVSCHAGACVVHSCSSGFAPNGSSCASTGTGRQTKGDGAFWSALEVLVARTKDEKK